MFRIEMDVCAQRGRANDPEFKNRSVFSSLRCLAALPSMVLWAAISCLQGFAQSEGESVLTSQSEQDDQAIVQRDPVEMAYEQLLLLDEQAMDEIDTWIRQAGEESLSDDSASNSITLPARIEQRLGPVRKAYVEFIESHPTHVGVRLAFASFLTDRGLEMDARPHLIKATELDPQNAPAWNNLGNHYGHMGPVQKAFECYEMAITLNPEAALYYHNFGTTVYLFRKDSMAHYQLPEEAIFDKALELYQVALSKEPQNFDLAEDIAQTYYGIRSREIPSKMARPEAAIKAWDYALAIAPGDIEKQGVLIHLARVKLQLGELDEAQQHLDQVLLPMYQELKDRVGRNLSRRRQDLLPDADLR